MKYHPTHVRISPEGEKRLKKALEKKYNSVSLLLGLDGDKVLLLTRIQQKRLQMSPAKIRLSKNQIVANKNHVGGFLFTLASILAATIPSVITAVAAGAIERAVSGNGLWLKRIGNGIYLKRNGTRAHVTQHGNKIQLNPTEALPEDHADGLFLIEDGHVFEPTEYHDNLKILY
jgi:hypothetical protein